ncbi:MAG: hypothetical protein ACLGIR_13860 [Actinomycetes bacterium]
MATASRLIPPAAGLAVGLAAHVWFGTVFDGNGTYETGPRGVLLGLVAGALAWALATVLRPGAGEGLRRGAAGLAAGVALLPLAWMLLVLVGFGLPAPTSPEGLWMYPTTLALVADVVLGGRRALRGR